MCPVLWCGSTGSCGAVLAPVCSCLGPYQWLTFPLQSSSCKDPWVQDLPASPICTVLRGSVSALASSCLGCLGLCCLLVAGAHSILGWRCGDSRPLPITWGPHVAQGSKSPCGHPTPNDTCTLRSSRAGRGSGGVCLLLAPNPNPHGTWQPPSAAPRYKPCRGGIPPTPTAFPPAWAPEWQSHGTGG